MGLISTEVEVKLSGYNIKYYENLGYEIPKEKGKAFREATIRVKVEDLPKYSEYKLDAECDNCKKQYKIMKKNYEKINRAGKIYCNKCAKQLFNSGVNHPNYNKNISMEEREAGRDYPEYTEFIKRVLARDNYTCQCCKKIKANLSVL